MQIIKWVKVKVQSGFYPNVFYSIRRILHITSIDEVMRCGRLRWFGHVQRRDADNVTRRVMNLAIPGTRRRGRPKKTWNQQLKDDMTAVGVTQDVALERNEWRQRTRPLKVSKVSKVYFTPEEFYKNFLSSKLLLPGISEKGETRSKSTKVTIVTFCTTLCLPERQISPVFRFPPDLQGSTCRRGCDSHHHRLPNNE